MHALPLRALALWYLLVAAACGGDDDGTDGSPPSDAALGADSSEILPDAGLTTACGDTEPVVYCERATEICVESDLGAGRIYDCVALPDGCDATRDCASCMEVCNEGDECLDSDQDNTITCACLECV